MTFPAFAVCAQHQSSRDQHCPVSSRSAASAADFLPRHVETRERFSLAHSSTQSVNVDCLVDNCLMFLPAGSGQGTHQVQWSGDRCRPGRDGCGCTAGKGARAFSRAIWKAIVVATLHCQSVSLSLFVLSLCFHQFPHLSRQHNKLNVQCNFLTSALLQFSCV